MPPTRNQTQNLDQWHLPLRRVESPSVRFHHLTWSQAIKQRFWHLVAPTRSDAFKDKQEYFATTFLEQVQGYNKLRKRVKQLYLISRSHRISQLEDLYHTLNLSEPPERWDDEATVQAFFTLPDQQSHNNEASSQLTTTPVCSIHAYDVLDALPGSKGKTCLTKEETLLLDEYCESITRTQKLRTHLQEVEDDLARYTHLIKTQATAELTYFRGFRDWCRLMLQITTHLSNSLIIISTLGAGLIYSTVFQATRGDVGLMCYCFPFFICGIILPVIIQIVLNWGANFQREAIFASQRFWTIIIGVFLFSSTLAVIASLIILNLTVFFLNRTDGFDPTLDAPSTTAPGILAFSITGSVFLLVIVGALLSAIGLRAFTTIRGIRAVLSAVSGINGQGQDALKFWLPV
ncbi:hypothetical protein MIND_01105700 [Mycena indigotica]|uniref:Uncharacterized protein n=1 Tax=Mycena indigotica TaxID=2126181 RepID=A0A8H6S9V8_9AGAR|nr:uncharacterized protein MIND_01105700 [Mycena indigotica]KAF7295655.1 hypothetical protein MIND_01105700 [Mycena indigotica]